MRSHDERAQPGAWRWEVPFTRPSHPVRRVLAAVVLLAGPAEAADAVEPKTRPADLASVAAKLHGDVSTVTSTPVNRFVEFRVCSPEHCWSESYLQWFTSDGSPRTVRSSVPIRELGYGTVVVGARWVFVDEKPRIEVRYAHSHADGPERTIVLRPGEAGKYSIEEP